MLSLKGTVPLRIRNVFSLHTSRLFWCEFPGFGDIGCTDVGLLSACGALSDKLPELHPSIISPPSGSAHLLEDGKLCAGCKQQWCPLLDVS